MNKKKSGFLVVRIDAGLKEQLSNYAAEEGRSLSNLVTLIITSWVSSK